MTRSLPFGERGTAGDQCALSVASAAAGEAVLALRSARADASIFFSKKKKLKNCLSPA